MKKWFVILSAMGLAFALAACSNKGNEPELGRNDVNKNEATEEQEESTADLPEEGTVENDGEMVTVDLMDAEGNSVGTAELTEETNGVLVKITAENLPAGPHGFHFHETGNCELPDFESAGGHFNPAESEHGLNNANGPHAGDLPNLVVDEDGKVDEEILAERVTLKNGEENSLFKEGGTALVIHANEDDGETQPAGDAGDRIVCGVIE